MQPMKKRLKHLFICLFIYSNNANEYTRANERDEVPAQIGKVFLYVPNKSNLNMV